MFWLLIPVLVAVAGDEDVDFGGARSDDVAASAVAPSPDSALRPLDFKGGGAPQQQRSGGSAVQEPAPIKKPRSKLSLRMRTLTQPNIPWFNYVSMWPV